MTGHRRRLIPKYTYRGTRRYRSATSVKNSCMGRNVGTHVTRAATARPPAVGLILGRFNVRRASALDGLRDIGDVDTSILHFLNPLLDLVGVRRRDLVQGRIIARHDRSLRQSRPIAQVRRSRARAGSRWERDRRLGRGGSIDRRQGDSSRVRGKQRECVGRRKCGSTGCDARASS